jgi:hypothetical protein
MTKNTLLNDLIGVILFSILVVIFHFISDPEDGLPLYSKISIVPIFALALSEMAELQAIAYRAPFRSMKTLMKGASFGAIMGCNMLVSVVDLTYRAEVIRLPR